MGRRREYPALLCGDMAVGGFDCGGGGFVEEVSESGELIKIGVPDAYLFLPIKQPESVTPNIPGR